MFELMQAGGWLMWPILACSITAMAIVFERLWTYQGRKVIPVDLLPQVQKTVQAQQTDDQYVEKLRTHSHLGRVLAAGLANQLKSRELIKEAIQEEGRQVVHELERYLNTLGTIAAITPLLGLLGTVIGMIKVFTAITETGVGNPAVLASGISEALITTAAGLSVAIVALMFHRYFSGRVDRLVVQMEEQAIRLVAIMCEGKVAESD